MPGAGASKPARGSPVKLEGTSTAEQPIEAPHTSTGIAGRRGAGQAGSTGAATRPPPCRGGAIAEQEARADRAEVRPVCWRARGRCGSGAAFLKREAGPAARTPAAPKKKKPARLEETGKPSGRPERKADRLGQVRHLPIPQAPRVSLLGQPIWGRLAGAPPPGSAPRPEQAMAGHQAWNQRGTKKKGGGRWGGGRGGGDAGQACQPGVGGRWGPGTEKQAGRPRGDDFFQRRHSCHQRGWALHHLSPLPEASGPGCGGVGLEKNRSERRLGDPGASNRPIPPPSAPGAAGQGVESRPTQAALRVGQG